METPYYLKQDVKVTPFGSVDLYDFETPSMASESPRDLWTQMSESLNQAGDYVWEPISGTWKSLKEETANLLDSVVEGAEKAYSWVKWELVFWLGVVVLVLWYVAKSGILKQAAAFI